MKSDPRIAVFWVVVAFAALCFGYVFLVGCGWHWWDIDGDPHLLGWLAGGGLATLIAGVLDR